ncbi:MAG: hypothetical protein AB7O45_09080 [Alphaproteobacteria bacterium]
MPAIGAAPLVRSRAIVWAAIAVALAARLWFDWTGSLLDQHAFRQTQTAMTVYWYLREGIDLWRPPLPVFGVEAPSIPLEFPLYQAVAAQVLDLLGARSLDAIEVGCRAVSFAFHLLAAWPLHRLAARHFSPMVADGAVLLWLALPFPAFWSTAAMIESTAVALALLHVDRVDRAARSSGVMQGLDAAIAMVAGMLAATIKITTFAPYLPVAGLLYLSTRRLWSPASWRFSDLAVIVAAFLVPLVALAGWTAWADAVKAENTFGGLGLVSTTLAGWNFGTWSQRLSRETWRAIAVMLVTVALGLPVAAAAAIGAIRALGRFTRALWIVAGGLGPLLFINLYYIHDYYLFALLPPMVMLAAFGAVTVVAPLRRWPWLPALAIVAMTGAAWTDAAYRWRPRPDRPATVPVHYLLRRLVTTDALPPDAAIVRDIAERIRDGRYPPGPIVVTGNDWSPDIAFYAERKAYMIGKPPDHIMGGCSARNWEAARRARPALFVMVRPGTEQCPQGQPVPDCTLADTPDYWIGTCMAGVR